MLSSRTVSKHGLFAIVVICFLLLYSTEPLKLSTTSATTNFDSIALDFYFRHLHGPSVTPTNESYSLDHAFFYELSGPPLWTQNLKERLCIVDLHNGTFNDAGEAFSPNVMSWKDHGNSLVGGLSLGMLNHWIYAKIHGYKYYHIHVEELHDRRISWSKPKVLGQLLQNHDVCVYLDTDATFARLDLPLEWLFNYWQINPGQHSLALAEDPQLPKNLDDFGKVYHNTGFITLLNNPQTFSILQKWSQCPDDGEPYPDCTRFRNRKRFRLDRERKNLVITGTDQAGFGNYVRYDFPEAIASLNCSEANGFPLSGTECEGTFVRHFWTGKESHIKVDMAGQAPGRYLELLSAQFRRERAQFWVEEASLDVP